MPVPARRTLTDAERLAALREHLARGGAAKLHVFPGGASFEFKGVIIRMRDEEIVRAVAGQSLPWEDEDGDPAPKDAHPRPPTSVERVPDRAVVDLTVVERARTYRADHAALKANDDPSGDEPTVR